MKNLKQLLERMEYECLQGDLNRQVSDVIYDARILSCPEIFPKDGGYGMRLLRDGGFFPGTFDAQDGGILI